MAERIVIGLFITTMVAVFIAITIDSILEDQAKKISWRRLCNPHAVLAHYKLEGNQYIICGDQNRTHKIVE